MRNVLVTGASRGIGLAIARSLTSAGFCVTVVARRQTSALAEAMAVAGGALSFESFDLAEAERIPAFVRALKKRFGPFYGLVNNAALGADGLLANMRLSEIEAVVRLNTISPMVLTKHLVRGMMTEGQGRVVNIASIVAETGVAGLSVYGATKASIIGFTRSLARELGPLGITVNAVAPGFVDTEMTAALGKEGHRQVIRRTALRRLTEAEDVAEAVAYLMSDAARNVTGTVLTVDAGATA